MGFIMKYVYTDSASTTVIQQFMDDTADVGARLYHEGGYDTINAGDRPEVIGKVDGISNPVGQRTIAFGNVHNKFDATGSYCLNPRDYYANETWVDELPDYNDYDGLIGIDDVSQWQEPFDNS